MKMLLVIIIAWGGGFGRWLWMVRGLGWVEAGGKFKAQRCGGGFIAIIVLRISMRIATIRSQRRIYLRMIDFRSPIIIIALSPYPCSLPT